MNNQAHEGRSLKFRISRLLGDQTMADIKFLVGEELEEFPAHKLIFATSSDEFFNGFYAMTPDDNIIKLPEIKVESFKEFLSYIYTEEANINPENILDVMKLGDRYGIQHLMSFCYESAVKFIDEHLHLFENLLNFSKFSENVFLEMIARDPLKYLTADNVKWLNKDCLKVILEAKESKASEKQLFDLAVMWASEKMSADKPMKIRECLGDLILLIRFPTMNLNEFEKCIQEHDGILESRDVIEILLYISKQSGNSKYPVEKRNMENAQQVQPLPVALPDEAPKTTTSKKYERNINYYYTITNEFFVSESSFSKPLAAKVVGDQPLYFSVKAACTLESISYYVNGKFNDKFDLHVIVSVCGPRVTGTIQEIFEKFNVDPNLCRRKSVELHTICLNEKILLEPNEFYSIQLKFHCGKDGLNEYSTQKKFQRIVLTFPKVEREGNIILSELPEHRASNDHSSISSICYNFQKLIYCY